MSRFTELLADPTPEALAAALARASAAADEKRLRGRLDRDASFWQAVTTEGREGSREWLGGDDSLQSRARLSLAWWNEHVGRRHVRIRSGPSSQDHRQREAGSPLSAHPLWHVFPPSVVVRRRGGTDELLAFCPSCGLCGPPESLAWAGETCGPCNDRREEGGRPAFPPAALPNVGEQITFAWAGTGCILVHVHSFFVALATATGHTLAVFNPNARSRGMMEFSHSGWRAAAPVEGAKAHVYSIMNKSTRVIDLPQDVFRLRFSPDDRWLIATGEYQHLIDLQAEDGDPRPWPPTRRLGAMSEAAWLPDGSGFYAVAADGALLRVARDTGDVAEVPLDPAAPLSPADNPEAAAFALAYSPDGHWLSVHACSAGGSPLDAVRLCHLPTGDWWTVRQGGVDPPAFSPDSTTLAVKEGDGVRFWDLATRRDLGILHVFAGFLNEPPFAFSPDGRTLAVATLDDEIRLIPWRDLILDTPGR